MKPLNNKGVTLVEAICALAILAIVGVLLAGVFTNMFNISRRARDVAAATSTLNRYVNMVDMDEDGEPDVINVSIMLSDGEPLALPVPIYLYEPDSIDGRARIWFTRRQP